MGIFEMDTTRTRLLHNKKKKKTLAVCQLAQYHVKLNTYRAKRVSVFVNERFRSSTSFIHQLLLYMNVVRLLPSTAD